MNGVVEYDNDLEIQQRLDAANGWYECVCVVCLEDPRQIVRLVDQELVEDIIISKGGDALDVFLVAIRDDLGGRIVLE